MNALVGNPWVHFAVAVAGLSLVAYFHLIAALETWWLLKGLWNLRRPPTDRWAPPLGIVLLAVRAPFFWAMIGGFWWSILRGRGGG